MLTEMSPSAGEKEEEKGAGTVVFGEIQFCFTWKTKTLLISDIGRTSPAAFLKKSGSTEMAIGKDKF